jgi:hypothetical protein
MVVAEARMTDKGKEEADEVGDMGGEAAEQWISVLSQILDEFVWGQITQSVNQSLVDLTNNEKPMKKTTLEAYAGRTIDVLKLEEMAIERFQAIAQLSATQLKASFRDQLKRIEDLNVDPVARYCRQMEEGIRILISVRDELEGDFVDRAHEYQKVTSALFQMIEYVPAVTTQQEENRKSRKTQRTVASRRKTDLQEIKAVALSKKSQSQKGAELEAFFKK